MNIALFTYNHVVKEFIGLVAKKLGADLDIAEEASSISGKKFDYIFIDNKDDLMQQADILAETGSGGKTILLYTGVANGEKFDYLVKKPFLPSEIESLINECESERNGNAESEKDDDFYTDESMSYSLNETENQILRSDDIEEIKTLLGESGMTPPIEDAADEEPIAINKQAKKSKTSKKNKKRKSYKKVEKKLLKALYDMNKKEIKRLLKGAKITLKIDYLEEK